MFDQNELVICGHTHAAEFDLKNRFINTGFIAYYSCLQVCIAMPEQWDSPVMKFGNLSC